MEYFFIVFNIKGSLIDHLCKVCMRPTFKATLISNFKTASYFQKKKQRFSKQQTPIFKINTANSDQIFERRLEFVSDTDFS